MTSSNNNSDKKVALTPLFDGDIDAKDAELMRDKVRTLFEHFDVDGDEHLKFAELAALQKATAGTLLTEEMYMMACRALDCTPHQGISLDALKLTYAAEGSDIGTCSTGEAPMIVFFCLWYTYVEKDYYTVFPDRDPNKKDNSTPDKGGNDDEEQVYEIGADGTVDISS